MAAETAPWLEVTALRVAYGGVLALDSASLSLRSGEIRGLVGANGAGKSTVVKALTGLVTPARGEVRVDGSPLPLGRSKESLRAGIASVPQELTVAPTMTVAENVMLGHYPRSRLGRLREREMRAASERVLASLSLEIPSDELVGRLPLIEQRLVMVARALSFSARLVIFDEPTATISPLEVELLLQAIRTLAQRSVSVLFVSHHLGEVERICDSVTVLRDGRVIADLAEREASHATLVDLLSSGTDQVRHRERLESHGDVLFAARSVEGERLRDVTLSVHAGEIVGLAGLAGSGARELLLTVCGAVRYTGGALELAGRPLRSGNSFHAVAGGVGFLPGDRSLGVLPSHSVGHNVSLAALRRYARGPFVHRNCERAAVAELLDRVGLRARPEARIASLSGGNQQKALVARWIASGARLLLLDDPTAGVDVATRPEIHHQILELCEAGAGVLLVSTDLDELVELSDRVVVFGNGAVTGELAGSELTPARLLTAMTAVTHH